MKYLNRYRDEILIFSFFILVSIVATYPLIFRMRSYLYGLGGDALGGVWGIWWRKYAYLNHISSKSCPLIASPFGIDFPSFGRYILWEGLLFPFTLLSNEIFAYNFFILVSFFLSAIIVYYLIYHFTRNKLASMIAGVIYTLCPYHFAHSASHLTLVAIQWMSLYALTLFKLDEERNYRWALLTALAFSLVFLSDYYYGYFMAVFTVAFLAWKGWQGLREWRAGSGEQWAGEKVSRWESEKVSDRAIETERQEDRSLVTGHSAPEGRDLASGGRSPFKTAKVMLVAVVVAAAIILPFTHSFLQNMFTAPEEYARPFRDLTSNSARPLGYLLPSQDNPFFGGFTKRFIKSPFYGGHPVEHTLYLGWVGIVLSIVAIREWRRKNALMRNAERVHAISNQAIEQASKRATETERRRDGETERRTDRSQKAVSFFLFAAIVALLFSHSPYTEIGNFRILFPSYFMYKILPMFRVYARFGIVVMLCVSVLAGIGLTSILKKVKSAKKRRIFLSIVLLLVFIEFAPTLPAPMVNAVNPPPVYEWLAKQKGDFVIVEYPIETDYEYLFWQRIHQKRLVNGAQPGTYADKVRKEIVDILKLETPGILKYLGAKYIILHPDKYLKSEDVPVIGVVPDVSKQKGLRLIKTFEEARVYEVTAEPVEPKVEKVRKWESEQVGK